jgi:hypothetical protein
MACRRSTGFMGFITVYTANGDAEPSLWRCGRHGIDWRAMDEQPKKRRFWQLPQAMSEMEPPKKPPFQFSLRSLIIMAILVSCILFANIHLAKMLYSKLNDIESEHVPRP